MRRLADVLVVDDDENMRRTLSEILEEDGYSSRCVATGEEAVELCRSHTFRLVLMDMRMPGIDGLEAFRQIRQHCRRAQVVLMTAYSHTELERTALAAGFLAVLPKPLNLEAVSRVIAEVTSTTVLNISPATSPPAWRESALKAGFRVSSSESLTEATELVRQISFDAIVLDAAAASEGLAAAVQSLRGETPDSWLIVVQESPEVLMDGVRNNLTKPLSTESLLDVLEEIHCARAQAPGALKGRPAE